MIKRILALIIALTIAVCVPFTCFAQEEKEQPTEHIFKEEVSAATCTNVGTEKKICTVHENCSENVEKVIPALGHDLKATEEVVAPTCTASGYTVYKCTRCNDYTYNVIDPSKPATGHSYKWTYDHASKTVTGTCANNCGSTVTYTISDDGTEHSFTVQSYTAPKCNADGSLVLKCTKPDCTKTETIVLKSESTEHNYETVINFGTGCEDKGSAVTKCTYCGKIKETVEIPANGHNYGEPVHYAATCTSKAYNEYECSVCHDKKVVFDEDSKPTGHNFTKTDSTATCTEPGTITVSCEACKISETVNVPALGHDFVATDEVVASTCKEVGYTVYKCSRCDETKTVYSGEIGEHKWSGYEPVQTATADRCGIEKRTCSECGAVDYKITNSTGDHNYTDTRTKEPTCTEEGVITRHCNSHSDEADQLIPIPATGHTVVTDPATPADCTTPGTTAKVYCEKRDMVYLESKTVAALGHRYEVKSVENATCKDAAKVTLECTVCHAETTVSQGTVGNHSYTKRSAENDIFATCTADGYEAWKCETCGDIKYVKSTTEKATGHKVDKSKTETTEATHTAAGSVRKYCSCGQLMDVEVIQPSHKFEWKAVEAATCSKEGIEKQICSVCKAEGETKTIEKLAHRFEWRVIKDATCAAEGSRKQVCTVCRAEGKTETIAKTAHNYEWITVKEATCKENGSRKQVCTVCKTVGSTGVIPETKNHDYEWKTEKAATCKDEGSRIQVCSVCGAKGESEVLSKTAHNYKWKTVKEATCKNKGSRKQVCTVCKAVGKTETTKKTAHKWSTSSSKCTVCEEKDVAKRIISAKCNPSVYYVGDTWQSEMIMEVEYRYHTACIRSTIKPSTFSTNKPNSISVKLQSGDLISKPIKITVNKAQKPTVKTKKNSATVSWKKVNGAEGYVVKVYKGSKLIGTKSIESGSTTSCSFKKLAKSTNYKFVVQYKRGGMTQTSKFTTTAKTKAK